MLLRKSLLTGGLLLAGLTLLNGCNKTAAPGEAAMGTASGGTAQTGAAPKGSVAGEASARTTEIKQSLAFDHAAHIKAEDMDCLDCHKFAEKGPYATLPRVKDCTDCHSEPQGKNPEELKVRDYTEHGKEIAWVTVNRLPGHVYFSHRAHVEFGEMKCWDCHRDMRKVSAPVVTPDIGYLTMSKCIACHKQRQVETDCATCHK